MIHILRCALILTLFVFGVSDTFGEILLQEDFEGELDLTTKWQTGHPKFVYPKEGILYLDQGKSGGDYVSLRSVQHFNDVIRHYINLIVKCFSVSLGSVGAGFPRPIARHQRSYPGRGDLAPTRFPECLIKPL